MSLSEGNQESLCPSFFSKLASVTNLKGEGYVTESLSLDVKLLSSTVRFEQCNNKSLSVSNRASLKILAFAASDSLKSSIKIAKYRGEKV